MLQNMQATVNYVSSKLYVPVSNRTNEEMCSVF
jgi:hypothetical protein